MMRHMQTHLMVDYSPTEAADLGLIGGLKRPTIYKWIKQGDIRTITDAHGHIRITAEEIERLHALWKSKQPSQELLIKQAIKREMARANGHRGAAMHSREELTAPLREGKRRAIIRTVDPLGKLAPDELERRIDHEMKSQMARVRAAKLERALLRQQYGHEPA